MVFFVGPHLLLRTTFVFILQVTAIVAQSPIFFNCSKNLLLSREDADSRVALFNLNANNVSSEDVIDISNTGRGSNWQAAIDEESGILYIVNIRSGPVNTLYRFNATDSALSDWSPFRVDMGGLRVFALEFVHGFMYFVTGMDADPINLVQAQVNETPNPQGDATLDITNSSVVELSGSEGLTSLAWDSCTSTMYYTSNVANLFAIDINAGTVMNLPRPALKDDDRRVNFYDTTVSPPPDCVLYGVISSIGARGEDITLRGWVASIDTDTGEVTPLSDTEVEGEINFNNTWGIASCGDPPPTATPTKMPTQPPVMPTQPPPPINCSEDLLLSSGIQNTRAALYNLNSNMIITVIDILDPTPMRGREAAIDEESGILYIASPVIIPSGGRFYDYFRYNISNSSLPDMEPFRLETGGKLISGHDFIDGEMYFLELELDDPSAARLVHAQVVEPTIPGSNATLNILNDSVADLGTAVTRTDGPIAWDSCTSTMYYSTAAAELLAINITSGTFMNLPNTTFVDNNGTLFDVTFTDITVGPSPDCMLYGVIGFLRKIDGTVSSSLFGWVGTIDHNTGRVTPLANTTTEEFGDTFGIASCSNPPPPVMPPDNDRCYVDPYYPSKEYDSKSFLEGWYYDLGDICAHDHGGHNGQYAGNKQVAASAASSVPRAGGTFKVCCKTGDASSPDCVSCNDCSVNQEVNDRCCAQAWHHYGNDYDHHRLRQLDGTYEGSKTKGQTSKGSKSGSKGSSQGSSDSSNDMYYGGCKAKLGKDYVCCKCARGYTCVHKSNNCTTACDHRNHE